MTPAEQADAAMKRLKEWIARSCGQHMRALREQWQKKQ